MKKVFAKYFRPRSSYALRREEDNFILMIDNDKIMIDNDINNIT